jgi:hypothetical protein
MDQSYLSFLYIVSQKMIPHFYVLGFGMEHWVLEPHMVLNPPLDECIDNTHIK